jgi:hypothetical protein
MLFPTLVTPLIQNRALCWGIFGAAGLHLGLRLLGLPSWPCPVRYGLGFPCPSCGLSRATIALLQGQWQLAIAIHAFAPMVLVLLAFLLCSNFVTPTYRATLLGYMHTIEQKTGLSTIVLAIFLLYWLIRLCFFRETLYRLIM